MYSTLSIGVPIPPFETTLFMDGPKGAEIFYLVVVDGEAIISFSFYVKAGTTGYFYLAVYTPTVQRS